MKMPKMNSRKLPVSKSLEKKLRPFSLHRPSVPVRSNTPPPPLGSHYVQSLQKRVAYLEEQQYLQRTQMGIVYEERDMIFSTVMYLAEKLRYPVGKVHDPHLPKDDPWSLIVFAILPVGSISWHVHQSEHPYYQDFALLEWSFISPYIEAIDTNERYYRMLHPFGYESPAMGIGPVTDEYKTVKLSEEEEETREGKGAA